MGGAVTIWSDVGSWGGLQRSAHRIEPLSDRTRLSLRAGAASPGLAYGNGRSYGDVCLNPGGLLWKTRNLDRFISFDPATGQLECEAGVLLDEIIAMVLPQGWFLPVTPGTRFVTVGGAIANDVHGKNHHHAGSFGEHVLALSLLRSDGQRLECNGTQQADLLRASIGGLGLTGVIVSAKLQLRRVGGPWLDTETTVFDGLDAFFALSGAAEQGCEYNVAWIDCLHGSRGVFFRANHGAGGGTAPPQRQRDLRFTPPLSLINTASLRLFNAAYFRCHAARQGASRQAWAPFFYPLDGILHWNRIYGPQGFYQYQCVIPRAAERSATPELLAAISASGMGSFLAVLKTFGTREPAGLLSFPMAGTTLALDFPHQGERTLALFERLDAIVVAAGGRLYPAKDARMSRAMFESGQPRLAEFLPYRDPGMSSAMSRRLLGS